MALNARERIGAVDVLQIDYEFATISFYDVGAVNDIGEPALTLTERSTQVRCSIDPLVRLPTFINQSGIRRQLEQGITEQSSYYMVLAADQTILPGDVVTNVDGDEFDVLHVVNWFSHGEAFLRKLT